jgi:hypothetical protein
MKGLCSQNLGVFTSMPVVGYPGSKGGTSSLGPDSAAHYSPGLSG